MWIVLILVRLSGNIYGTSSRIPVTIDDVFHFTMRSALLLTNVEVL